MKTNGKKTSIFHFCFLLLIIIIYTNNTHHTVQAQELLFDTVDYSWSNYSQYSDRYYNWKNDDYENFEMKWFKDGHNKDIIEGRRLAWYFNKVGSSTDNADKSMSNSICSSLFEL